MQKWIGILSGLLVAQLALAVAVNLTGEDYGAFQAEEKLLSFDAQSVDGLRIEEGEASLVLQKRDGTWRLPESGDFPVTTGQVEGLVEKLSRLEKGWPVATTSGGPRRFKVSEEQFERKLTLLAEDETLGELYIGTSPGFRKVHVRPAEEDQVFAVTFNTWEANAKADDWIDKAVLSLDVAEVERLELPGIKLQQTDGKLHVEGLSAEEETNVEAVRSLLGKLTGLRIESLLGTEAKPEYLQDEPALEVKVARKDGDALSYLFSKPKEASYYVLKRSDLEHYLKVAATAVQPIEEATRETLVRAKPKAISSEAPASQGPDVTTQTAE